MIGDIIFVRGHSWVSRLIRLFDGEFSHVCLVVSETHIIESQRFVKSRITPMNYSDYTVVSMNLTETEQSELLKSAIRYCGNPYDYKQLFSLALKRVFGVFKPNYNNKRKYICSELVELVLNDIGKIEENSSLGYKSPNELFLYLKNLN